MRYVDGQKTTEKHLPHLLSRMNQSKGDTATSSEKEGILDELNHEDEEGKGNTNSIDNNGSKYD